MKAFDFRRVKSDMRDAADLADLLRLGRLPQAWIAPPATRELVSCQLAPSSRVAGGAIPAELRQPSQPQHGRPDRRRRAGNF